MTESERIIHALHGHWYPVIQVAAAIDHFAAKLVVRWAAPLMAPLRKFVAIADQFKLRVAQDVVAVIVENIGHRSRSFRCVELQRMNAP